jgi:hypothetical protein
MPSLVRLPAAACLSAILTFTLALPTTHAAPGGNAYGKDGKTDSGGDTDSGSDEPSAAVYVSFASSSMEVARGETVLLSWASFNSRHCFASGDWSGKLATEGFHTTPPLESSKTFTLECKTGGNSVRETLSVAVTGTSESELQPPPEPAPAPEPAASLTLRALDAEVRTGGSASLSWSGVSVSNCQASGAWSGTRASTGSETVGPLSGDANFTLTCQSSTGNVMAMTAVLVTDGGTKLSWVPPTENVDGTPLSDLKGYRIYVGTLSRKYTTEVELTNPKTTEHFLPLPRGEYYVAMTALDADGNESGYSNEVLKAVN